ncbi:right-handed parallel beta-helix repeat-containing protein [uncultured Jatrophihabitans sp.]|uniref:right-handed parallel beta-helix repeat-containing protein n=1 Tax=uncultured Jatrophihabitans sp. TaxID=1610747 RepID=UPI0035C9BB5A
MAAYPDQLFVDGAQFAQVASTTTPGPGQFAVNDSTDQLILGSDPTGHSVRASDLSQAFVVSGQVTVRGFGVRRYATSLPQIGTVYLGGSVGGDVLQNLVISDNATQGLSFSASRTLVDHVTASANGMVGIHSNNSSGSVIQNSLISGNNTQHFNSAPAAAGIKVTRDDGLVIRNNDVVDNLGVNGIWTDVSVSNFAIVGNTVARNNGTYGIITELSDTGIVAGNAVSDATRGYTAFDTGNVRVFNNVFSGNSVWDVGVWQDARRNTGSNATTIPWISRNISVSNNVFASSTGMFQFYALDKATNTPASGMNLVVTGNVFGLFPSGPRMVGWGGSNNVQVTSYASPAALNTGVQVSWRNMQVQLQAPAMATPALTAAGTLIAVPLPADIASQLGVAAGTAQLGAF